MENEIKVNEYVRLKTGEIFKVDENCATYLNYDTNERKGIKHSPNLIDIIELGDCVKLFMEEFVDEGKIKEDTNIFEVIAITTDKKEIGVFTKDFEIEFFPIENIREIYTQEMMESISYKVKE